MKRLGKSMLLAVLLAGALVTILTPNAAAQTGSIVGTILVFQWEAMVSTDHRSLKRPRREGGGKNGRGRQICHPQSSAWSVYFDDYTFPPPNDKQPAFHLGQMKATSGEETKMPDMNFKELYAKAGAEAAEKTKKDVRG